MIDWTKVGVYAAVILLTVAGCAVYFQPQRPPHPVEIVKPAPPPAPQPPVIEPPKAPEVVITDPPKPKPPVVKPPVVKPTKPRPQRPINQSPGCRDIPRAAYNHPIDVVVASARRMGLTEDRITILVRCLKGENVVV